MRRWFGVNIRAFAEGAVGCNNGAGRWRPNGDADTVVRTFTSAGTAIGRT